VSKNDITGDSIISKQSNANYEAGYDLIWGKKTIDRSGQARAASKARSEKPWNAPSQNLRKSKKAKSST